MNLVFASGFLVPQQFLGFNYFRDVRQHVIQEGHHAIMPKVPPLGTCEERADALASAIHQTFPTAPVHIIAHSMGGLDSRMLIGRNLFGLADPGRIASLTTLSTPHFGSPVADLLAGRGPEDLRRKFAGRVTAALALLGIEAGAIANLTTEMAGKVPNAAQIHPQIRYRSYFASGREGHFPTSLLLAPTHEYVQAVTGEDNDGLVARSSAKYGDFQEPSWPCDHADIVGYNLDTAGLGPPVFPHIVKIDEIIAQLED
jgi:triacylglycerol lipase